MNIYLVINDGGEVVKRGLYLTYVPAIITMVQNLKGLLKCKKNWSLEVIDFGAFDVTFLS